MTCLLKSYMLMVLIKKVLTFFYSYLKRRKQNFKINDTESFFQIFSSGVPQGSILGPILFNPFTNDLFFFIKESELANFADDNTMYMGRKDFTELLTILQKECETAINWFKRNNMIVNPNTFQLMIVSSAKDLSKSILNINGIESSVTFLSIEIDNKLNTFSSKKFQNKAENVHESSLKFHAELLEITTSISMETKNSLDSL